MGKHLKKEEWIKYFDLYEKEDGWNFWSKYSKETNKDWSTSKKENNLNWILEQSTEPINQEIKI